MRGQFDDAIQHYRDSIRLALKHDFTACVSDSERSLAQIDQHREDWQKQKVVMR